MVISKVNTYILPKPRFCFKFTYPKRIVHSSSEKVTFVPRCHVEIFDPRAWKEHLSTLNGAYCGMLAATGWICPQNTSPSGFMFHRSEASTHENVFRTDRAAVVKGTLRLLSHKAWSIYFFLGRNLSCFLHCMLPLYLVVGIWWTSEPSLNCGSR